MELADSIRSITSKKEVCRTSEAMFVELWELCRITLRSRVVAKTRVGRANIASRWLGCWAAGRREWRVGSGRGSTEDNPSFRLNLLIGALRALAGPPVVLICPKSPYQKLVPSPLASADNQRGAEARHWPAQPRKSGGRKHHLTLRQRWSRRV